MSEKPNMRGLIVLTKEEVERAMKKFEKVMKDDPILQEVRRTIENASKEEEE